MYPQISAKMNLPLNHAMNGNARGSVRATRKSETSIVERRVEPILDDRLKETYVIKRRHALYHTSELKRCQNTHKENVTDQLILYLCLFFHE